MKTIINWGILGCARIARDRFIPGIMKSEHGNIYAIASRSEKKLNDFLERFPFEKAYLSYEEILEDPEVDAVYIPLPNHLHKEWVIKAARKGKHVLCEKPMALNQEEVKEMMEESQKNGVILAEAFGYLHGDVMLQIEQLLQTNVIGELRHLDARFQICVDNMGIGKKDDIRYQKEYGGGVIYDLGCYAISFMRSIYQEEPCKIQVLSQNAESGIAEHASLNLQFPSGRTANAFVSFDSFYEHSRTLIGEKGSIIIPIPFNFQGEGKYYLTGSSGVEEKKIHCRDHYMLEAEDFNLSILEKREPKISLNYSMKNMKVIDEIHGQMCEKRVSYLVKNKKES